MSECVKEVLYKVHFTLMKVCSGLSSLPSVMVGDMSSINSYIAGVSSPLIICSSLLYFLLMLSHPSRMTRLDYYLLFLIFSFCVFRHYLYVGSFVIVLVTVSLLFLWHFQTHPQHHLISFSLFHTPSPPAPPPPPPDNVLVPNSC